jgi:hypothetical protein
MAPQPGMPGMPGAPQLANALITRLPVQEMIDLLAKRQAGLPKGR